MSSPYNSSDDSSFFLSHAPTDLPTPSEVRRQATNYGMARFDELGVFVKFGSATRVRVDEALALRMVNQAFPRGAGVPTPEIYGYQSDEDELFIYMELIQGPSLREAWPTLDHSAREAVVIELSTIIKTLRTLEQKGRYIGSCTGGPVQDKYCDGEIAGPFKTVHDFNNWVELASMPGLPPDERPELPYRAYLPDDVDIVFTHGDLARLNVILSPVQSAPPKIAAIIDWEQSGWYPAYWEYCKLLLGESCIGEWRTSGWVDKLMKPEVTAFTAIAEYWSWRVPC